VRFSHTVFALPFALAAAALAARGAPRPGALRIVLVVLAVVCARTAAMGWNRIVDRAFDAENPRTRDRELPRGAVSPGAALALTVTAAVGFLVCAAALSPLCGALAPLLLGLLGGYSYAKRFTWASHGVLGLALAAAPLGAWIAVAGRLDRAALPLALAVATWVAGFDLLYALADLEFDRQAGLRSIPARFGARATLGASAALHAVTAASLVWLGLWAHLGLAYALGVAAIAILLVWEHRLVRPGDLARLDAAFFTMNGWISIVFLVCTLVDVALR
jgi:4-hydroxybenzoate polyprenyltransferase